MSVFNYSVYKHENIANGKVYIGLTSIDPKERWKYGQGYSENKEFYSDIKVFGWSKGFTHEILKEGLSVIEAYDLEAELIEKYDSTNSEKGYNKAKGTKAPQYLIDIENRKVEEAKLEKIKDTIRDNVPMYYPIDWEQCNLNELREIERTEKHFQESFARIRSKNVKTAEQHKHIKIDIKVNTAREVKALFDNGDINEEQFDALLWQVYELNKRIV